MKQFRGSWALVTGATSGIGEACAASLAELGLNLILTGRRAQRLEALTVRLKQIEKNIQIRTLIFDISDKDRLSAALDTVLSELSELVLVINNAGLALGTDPIQSAEIADWDAMIDTNVKGLLYITRFCLPFLIEGKRGHVINIGSVAGRWTYPGGGVYSATKFAVRAISEGLRLDLIGSGIRVTNIEPGMVETEFSQVRFRGDMERAKSVYAGLTPLSACDIAEAVTWCFLRPAHVNVQELVIFPTDQAGVGPYVNRKSQP